jgi:hypothetical protein
MHFNTINLVGQRFGKLLVETYLYQKSDRSYWECRCDCGRKEISTNHALKKMGKDRCKTCRLLPPAVPIFSEEDADLVGMQWAKDKLGYPRKHWTESMGVPRVGRCIRAHRVVMARVIGRGLGRWDLVDHINGNPMDNRRENLRLIDPAGNAQNRCAGRASKTGIRGVSWCKQHGKWKAGAKVNRKQHHVGYFNDIKEAEAAVIAKRKALGSVERVA